MYLLAFIDKVPRRTIENHQSFSFIYSYTYMYMCVKKRRKDNICNVCRYAVYVFRICCSTCFYVFLFSNVLDLDNI